MAAIENHRSFGCGDFFVAHFVLLPHTLIVSEVNAMPYERCYPGQNRALLIAGCLLLAIGILLVFLCVPAWAWLALLGILLIAAGFVLLKISQSGR